MNESKKNQGWVVGVALLDPSLADNTGDRERLVRALATALGQPPVTVDHRALAALPGAARADGGAVRCVLVPEGPGYAVADVFAPGQARPVLGLAVDLGTTRVVTRLADLSENRVLGQAAADNPQAEIGPDVLARIHHTDSAPGGMARLQALAVGCIQGLGARLAREAGLSAESIALVSLAGNTAMTHLFLGLPSRWIIREPYIPAANSPDPVLAQDLNLAFAPGCRVFAFPNAGSYFGGDLIAGICHLGMHQSEKLALLVDVGTNAEVVLGCSDWLMACAGAAGPALEGGITRMGVTARPGAIDRVHIEPETGRFVLHTIGDLPPVGICGSGVIDLAAWLFVTGRLDERGKFVAKALGDRLTVDENGLPAVAVATAGESATARPLLFSQADMDSLVRSKAAMYTILSTLASTVGVEFSDLSAFYVAGTFGAFIDPESAIAIGMIP
ncbi:MAG: ASKHA domain-containing protein, partial [Pseudomonadota bacterium]